MAHYFIHGYYRDGVLVATVNPGTSHSSAWRRALED